VARAVVRGSGVGSGMLYEAAPAGDVCTLRDAAAAGGAGRSAKGIGRAAGIRYRNGVGTAGTRGSAERTGKAARDTRAHSGNGEARKACGARNGAGIFEPGSGSGESGDPTKPGYDGKELDAIVREVVERSAAGSGIEGTRVCGKRERSDEVGRLGAREEPVEESGSVVGRVGGEFVDGRCPLLVPRVGLESSHDDL